MLFDTHAHYDDPRFDPDREALLARLPEDGVALMLNPGCDLESSRKARDYARRYPHVYAAVGIHPENCAQFRAEDVDELRALAEGEKKVRAIGEIGLDYHWADNPPKDLQQRVFRAQMALAEELDLPVIVHDRDAHADSMDIVRAFPNVRGVFHCYSGAWEQARELLDRGWMLSFTGVITYPNARKALEVIDKMPLDRIMIETDSPYLAPTPCRGKRNDSRNVRFVAETVAARRGLTPEEAARLTLENGKRFFGISE